MKQPYLFGDPYSHLSLISGLRYLPEFVSLEEEAEMLSQIDASEWITELKRRVQHYGYKYDYKRRSIDASMYVGALPEWSFLLRERFATQKIFPEPPDQLIVNEYIPGQGIFKHVDCVPCFLDTIVSVTLGSGCVMEFTKPKTKRKVECFLEPRSAVILTGESRYDWQHGIPSRKSDQWNGDRLLRRRRVSLTFRRVSLDLKISRIG